MFVKIVHAPEELNLDAVVLFVLHYTRKRVTIRDSRKMILEITNGNDGDIQDLLERSTIQVERIIGQ
ncbi:hypothetical protein A2917_00765 [Candidatus Nomurabacteria bacterium RIFCSPLOWO2_01_FULL_42_17]|uniref:Uncharacterized protein n=1 Tax=Candidatus Nomurabacteria bacterium RIFCSPLOWO2_01_FULL_42_17 TaxID=1801780 RepID=A0A1F6XMC0_9BACT|nr:MAG: hypothetical protein A2917_00765 [Candidatus Nomurabacteria bacterium RIFCSPLOWO2_01_FULL_42_17]